MFSVCKQDKGMQSWMALRPKYEEGLTMAVLLSNKEEKLASKALERLDDAVVLVEGKKDEAALQELGGFSRGIIQAVGSPAAVVAKACALNKRIILLFDFDEEGERKNAVFRDLFFAAGRTVDEATRRKVRKAFRVRTIEEMPAAFLEIKKG